MAMAHVRMRDLELLHSLESVVETNPDRHPAAVFAGSGGSAVRDLAYVSFQELATRVSHRNTGRATGCPIADRLLTRISRPAADHERSRRSRHRPQSVRGSANTSTSVRQARAALRCAPVSSNSSAACRQDF
ncbi:hypothetical protein P3T37_001617 [Kitasatospora sp. MAA4]|nr:hypothetical protein [Kitasatospora sp. MAA4]